MEQQQQETAVAVLAVWLTAEQAATRAQISVKTIYGAVKSDKLRAARIGGRRELRFRAEWIDQWLDAATTPQEVSK